jgi:hypothetical protein
MFYKAIAQAVLLYACKTWVIPDSMLKPIQGFHHRVARRISKKQPYKSHGQWVYPPSEQALEEAKLHPAEHYSETP